jgi:hypothetical protein
MDVPSIKGPAFRSVVEDVKRLIDADRIDPAEVAKQLNEKDRGFLDAEVTALAWCPIATYGRMLELLASEEGGDDPAAYLRERGARAADVMLSGVYESFRAAPGTWGPRVGQTMMGIGKLLYNFTSWSFRSNGGEIPRDRGERGARRPGRPLHRDGLPAPLRRARRRAPDARRKHAPHAGSDRVSDRTGVRRVRVPQA